MVSVHLLECLDCQDGFYQTPELTCAPCSDFGEACITCNADGCLDCYEGLFPDTDGLCSTCGARLEHCRACSEETGACVLCEPGYYEEDGVCVFSQKSTNDWACVWYSQPSYCKYCRRGFQAVNGQCFKTISGCTSYNWDGSCSHCKNSKWLSGGYCWSY